MKFTKMKKIFGQKVNLRFFIILAAISTFLIVIGVASIYKIFFTPATYIYVNVKVGQGYWWGNTNDPPAWYTNALKKGSVKKDILGKTEAEILSVRTYPSGNEFNAYVTIKLKVTYNSKTQQYQYDRSLVSISSPIKIQLSGIEVTGVVIDISKKPFTTTYVTKTITLLKPQGYTKDAPYHYDEIKIGDKYFDGESYAFEVIDKHLEKNIWTVTNNSNAEVYEKDIYSTQNIIIKAKVKAQKIGNSFYYGNTFKLALNGSMFFATPNYQYIGYSIINIE